jgi:cytoskeletal protein CcmA (bactofilin family)
MMVCGPRSAARPGSAQACITSPSGEVGRSCASLRSTAFAHPCAARAQRRVRAPLWPQTADRRPPSLDRRPAGASSRAFFLAPHHLICNPLTSFTVLSARLTLLEGVCNYDGSSNLGEIVMALWKDQYGRDQSTPDAPTEKSAPAAAPVSIDTARQPAAQPRADAKESLLAAGLTIEGKIEGAGHVRIAGNFKGDVHVQGNLTIESGAKVTGAVRANTVVVGGELEGNIDAAARVELLQTGVLNGDLKAGSLTVAAGSRMRGRAEFGWDEKGEKAEKGGKTAT